MQQHDRCAAAGFETVRLESQDGDVLPDHRGARSGREHDRPGCGQNPMTTTFLTMRGFGGAERTRRYLLHGGTMWFMRA